MKEIRAVIRPEKLREVLDALEETEHPGVSVIRMEGHGRQSGVVEQYRGQEFKVDLLPKVRIDIVCNDEEVNELAEVIAKSARTGEIGDGKVFIYPVEGALRIRTMEKGENAI